MPIDFEERVMDKFDNIEELIRDLCARTTKVESSLENHYDNIEKAQKRKDKKYYYIIALMGIGFTIQEIVRSLL